MKTAPWSAVFADLQDRIDELRGILDGIAPSADLTAAERRSLERAFDRFLTADDAVARQIETMVRRSTGRPRR